MKTRRLTSLVLLAASTASLASPTTVLQSDVVYELAADGTSTVERTSVTRLNEQIAVTAAGQASLQYSKSLQELEIIEAYTTTKDGQRIDVPADRIITQQMPGSAGAPTFSDYEVKNVVFPQLEIGATVTLRYRTKQITPQLPGVYSGGEVFSRFGDIESKTMTVRAPANSGVHVFARDVKGGPVQSSKPGMVEWRWTHGPTVADTPEPGMVDAASISPGVMFSNLKDYPALADAYMASAAPKTQITPAVQKLADEITQGITARRAQAEAIYRWVSSEIRYVAIAMGQGGYVPHHTDEILAARYGDCKDKTALLTALLGAKGIRAVPVLIRTGNRYKWQEIPLLAAFNHAIAYVPEFDLYLDATVALAPFDALPEPLRGRAVLVAGDAGAPASVRQTPAIDPARDRAVARTVAPVAADGSVTGTSAMEAHGAQEAMLRTTMSLIPAQLLPQLGKQMLSSNGQSGEAKMVLGDMKDFSKSNLMTLEFSTPERINLPGPGALTGGIGAQSSAGRSFVTSMLQQERKLDFPCPAGGTEEFLELALPAQMKITALPGAADIASSHGRFTSSHEVKDGKLLVTTKLALKPPQTVCSATDYAELRRFATAIDRELRKQILYE